MGIANEFGLQKLREITRHGSTFCKKSLAMGTTFPKNHPEDGYGVQGSGLTPPSQPNPSTPQDNNTSKSEANVWVLVGTRLRKSMHTDFKYPYPAGQMHCGICAGVLSGD